VPFIMIAVLFFFTARDESKLLQLKKDPAVKVNVVGRQWSWSFNYGYDAVTHKDGPGPAVYEVGTPSDLPVLWLPVNERVRFSLTSTDVIHSFWIPNFLFKLDVVPGRVNQFEVTPTKEGEFIGRCAELCGVDHSRMLFKVKVVSAADYQKHLQDLANKIDPVTGKGQTGQMPVGYNPNGVPLRVGPLTGIGNDSTGKEK